MAEKIFVSARWVCRRFEISHHTLATIVETLGDEALGRHRLPTQKHYRFERRKVEAALAPQE